MITRKLGYALTFLLMAVTLSLLSAGGGISSAQAREGDFSNPYIEVKSGRLPLIITVPHGGDLTPGAIPDRSQAVLLNDRASQPAARELAAALEDILGQRPWLIINHLDRRKLDPNRSKAQGAQGDPVAEAAWESYHGAIESASLALSQECSRGLLVDLHSYGAEGGLAQIGFGLNHLALDEEDDDLAGRRFIHESNVAALVLTTEISLPQVVRSEQSLGGRLQRAGYGALPSPAHPRPAYGYFDGGYSVYRHGSRNGGSVDAVQLEVPYRWLERTTRPIFIERLATILTEYLQDFYQLQTDASGDWSCGAFADVPPDHWASGAIEALFDTNKVEPCASSPRRFCPGDSINRGTAVAWLWRNDDSGEPPPTASLPVFADLDDRSAAVQSLWELGVVEACRTEPLRFCPEKLLTRAELAQWALRTKHGASVVPSAPSGRFEDVSRNDWDGWWAEQAYQEGLIQPCDGPQGVFLCPEQPVSRAEWAWALHQLP